MKRSRSVSTVRAGLAFSVASVAFLSLAACQQQSTPNPTNQAQSAAVTPVLAPLPASEYFETLTETAFSDSPAKLDTTIALARTAVARDRETLPASVTTQLDQRLQQIAEARVAMNRADLAIASIEGFRLVIAASPSAGPVPVQVSLLDYAGFRYWADLKAPTVRWDDTAAAADFAAAQWDEISTRVSDPALRTRFEAALTDMKAAAKARDAAAAIQAVTSELDLVDELEAHFTAHG